ncbi:MAG: alternative ribosome rescue aminoacyl-tRNA hydrolase ArfB [Ignavibacteriales bacterium]|nr:alternative ribosome rescue aminoacyl-tRNA hydrolase ArfB [Ignavibacteriales bacterium]
MIRINKNIALKESELTFKFIRSSGPGGQNVNKVATAVQLRFDITSSKSLTEDVKTRLKSIAGRKVTKDGVLIIEANRFRTQEKNRKDAIARLIVLIDKSSVRRKRRIKTNPSHASNQKRIEVKKRLSEKKKMRKYSDQS